MTVVWLVGSPASDEGGWVNQGIFSTEEAARTYADLLAFETYVQAHTVDWEPRRR